MEAGSHAKQGIVHRLIAHSGLTHHKCPTMHLIFRCCTVLTWTAGRWGPASRGPLPWAPGELSWHTSGLPLFARTRAICVGAQGRNAKLPVFLCTPLGTRRTWAHVVATRLCDGYCGLSGDAAMGCSAACDLSARLFSHPHPAYPTQLAAPTAPIRGTPGTCR